MIPKGRWSPALFCLFILVRLLFNHDHEARLKDRCRFLPGQWPELAGCTRWAEQPQSSPWLKWPPLMVRLRAGAPNSCSWPETALLECAQKRPRACDPVTAQLSTGVRHIGVIMLTADNAMRLIFMPFRQLSKCHQYHLLYGPQCLCKHCYA